MKEDIILDRSIAAKLQRAWPVFFENYGRLTPVQRNAILPILNGEDVLICSATASGKTEAVCAPLVERYVDINGPWTILYVSPTRALVNDLYERLWTPLRRLNLSIIRRTGDHATKLNKIPHVLITTPESFDSILCRGKLDASIYGHILSRVQAIVLDEIHLLHGSPRGEQVKWLIERLKRLKRQAVKENWCKNIKIQIVGLSATVSNPKDVINIFMPEGRVISVSGQREIQIVHNEVIQIDKALKKYISSLDKPEKILVFSKSRKRVDELSAKMKGLLTEFDYMVVAHHGSLSKKVREEAEEAIKSNQKIVAFATSTLEIGIDIGNIDLIVIDEPAPDVPALLQRIGRGNRRTNITKVLLCAENKADEVLQKAMIHAAINGWMCAKDNGPNFSVAMQQIASYIFQSPKRARGRKVIEDLIKSCINTDLFGEQIIDNMKQNEELIEDESGIRLGEYWLNLASNGRIHSNIDSAYGYSVIDEISGDKIATGISFAQGQGLKTGGQFLQIRRFDDLNIEVKKVNSENLAHGQWSYVGKRSFQDSSQAVSLRKYLDLDAEEWPVILDNGRLYVFHLGGGIRQTVIEALAKMNSVDLNTIESNQFYISFPSYSVEKPFWLVEYRPANFELLINSEIEWFESKLCRPLANKKLPHNIRVYEVKEWLNLDEELYNIFHCRFNANNHKCIKILKMFI
ncbi:MAG: DEAD/DEAH box helicase [Clostridiaceae bacterium]|nr:DEAD/DEAH box helicase [Clostridiaceae bacterium]